MERTFCCLAILPRRALQPLQRRSPFPALPLRRSFDLFFKTHRRSSTNNTLFFLIGPLIRRRQAVVRGPEATAQSPDGGLGPLFTSRRSREPTVTSAGPPGSWARSLAQAPARYCLRPSTRRVKRMARCHGFMGMECGVLCVQGSFPSIPHCPGAC